MVTLLISARGIVDRKKQAGLLMKTGRSFTVIDVDANGGLTARSKHTSHEMTVEYFGVGGENIDGDTADVTRTDEVGVNSDQEDVIMLYGNHRLAIATPTSFSPKSP